MTSNISHDQPALSPKDNMEPAEPLRGPHHTSTSVHSIQVLDKGVAQRSMGTLLQEGQHDPFVTPRTDSVPRLSATALDFHPGSNTQRAMADSTWLIKSSAPSAPSSTSALPGTAQHLSLMIAESKAAEKPAPDLTESKYGIFTTESGLSRSIKITGEYGTTVLPSIQSSLQALKVTRALNGSSIRTEIIGNIGFLRVGDVRDAVTIHDALKRDHPNAVVEFVAPSEFGQIISPGTKFSDHEGQVLLCATYPTIGGIERKAFEESLRALLSVEGPLRAWERVSESNSDIYQLIAEYSDAALAPRAVTRCAEQVVSGRLMATVSLYTPASSTKRHQTPEATPTRGSTESSVLTDSISRLSINSPHQPQYMTPMSGHSSYGGPRGHNQLMIGQPYSPTISSPLSSQQHYMGSMVQPLFSPSQVGSFNHHMPPTFSPTATSYELNHTYSPLQGQMQQNPNYSSGLGGPFASGSRHFQRPSPSRGSRDMVRRGGQILHHRRNSQSHATGPHNHVDIHKIQAGVDVRTTVMLRNIPNKLNQRELKEILDLSSFGKYDFMYLRIDFSNECNVGYAFVNFTDPLDIVPFVHARANQKWHKFKSDKIAEVSYATIQGRDCLIQKFRNSSVMLEPEHYRPKLFFTYGDPRGEVGEEDRFPSADNASKLKRSCENAEHVGLFAPSAGQHMRDEQRRRRSQFDRGTTLAEREDLDYEEDRNRQFGRSITDRYLL